MRLLAVTIETRTRNCLVATTDEELSPVSDPAHSGGIQLRLAISPPRCRTEVDGLRRHF